MIAARLLETLLFETRTRDPLAFGVTIAAIALTAWASCALPARRATRIDPLAALKAEQRFTAADSHWENSWFPIAGNT